MTSSPACDLAVVGLGGMGAAVAAHAAGRGLRVLGIERFGLCHTRGSTHGVTRILRLGLHEGADLVPLALRARALWDALGEDVGERLFIDCGSLDVGGPGSVVVARSRAACEAHGIVHEVLDARALAERVPGFRPDHDMVGVLQAGSGMVVCEGSLRAHLQVAIERGADLRAEERVLGVSPDGAGWLIRTARGTHRAHRVVVCPGAFAEGLLPELEGLVRPERQVVGWFQPAREPGLFAPERMPCWILDGPLGHFYGLPIHGVPGFKLSRMAHEEEVDPEMPTRPPTTADEAELRAVLSRWFPFADGPVAALETCLFESTPDRGFVIDELPGRPGVLVAAGFSGHGYKYASAVGELVTDLVVGDDPVVDRSRFSLARFRPVEHAA